MTYCCGVLAVALSLVGGCGDLVELPGAVVGCLQDRHIFTRAAAAACVDSSQGGGGSSSSRHPTQAVLVRQFICGARDGPVGRKHSY
jgi:hypothetical protein